MQLDGLVSRTLSTTETRPLLGVLTHARALGVLVGAAASVVVAGRMLPPVPVDVRAQGSAVARAEPERFPYRRVTETSGATSYLFEGDRRPARSACLRFSVDASSNRRSLAIDGIG